MGCGLCILPFSAEDCKNSKNILARNLGFCGIVYLYARKMMGKKVITFAILALMTVSCLDEPDCYLLNNHLVGIAFKKLEDSTADTVEISNFGTLEPPVLFLADTSVSRILGLPLKYFEDETTFVLEDAGTVHTLRLGYRSQAQFVSEKCGEKFVLSELRILERDFDSVRLVTDFPTRDGSAIQIEIFQ